MEYIEALLQTDIETNKAIGKHGADVIRRDGTKVNVLTHCNTGSLATAGYGTALGVVRSLFEQNQLGRHKETIVLNIHSCGLGFERHCYFNII